jgi:lysophospholipase L1-like esterase
VAGRTHGVSVLRNRVLRGLSAWLPAAALPLLAAVPTAAAQEAPAPKRSYVVAAVGDSLTDPRSGGGRYLDVLRKRCPKSRFDAYGVGGEMVSHMRARFARDVLGEPADAKSPKPRYTHVIVFGGVNDLYSDLTDGRTPAKIEADLTAMYEAARKQNMGVVAITVAPWGGLKGWYNTKRGAATREVNRWIAAQLKAGVIDGLVDSYPLLSCGNPERICKKLARKDGIHLNNAGHQVLGAEVYKRVFADCE